MRTIKLVILSYGCYLSHLKISAAHQPMSFFSVTYMRTLDVQCVWVTIGLKMEVNSADRYQWCEKDRNILRIPPVKCVKCCDLIITQHGLWTKYVTETIKCNVPVLERKKSVMNSCMLVRKWDAAPSSEWVLTCVQWQGGSRCSSGLCCRVFSSYGSHAAPLSGISHTVHWRTSLWVPSWGEERYRRVSEWLDWNISLKA